MIKRMKKYAGARKAEKFQEEERLRKEFLLRFSKDVDSYRRRLDRLKGIDSEMDYDDLSPDNLKMFFIDIYGREGDSNYQRFMKTIEGYREEEKSRLLKKSVTDIESNINTRIKHYHDLSEKVRVSSDPKKVYDQSIGKRRDYSNFMQNAAVILILFFGIFAVTLVPLKVNSPTGFSVFADAPKTIMNTGIFFIGVFFIIAIILFFRHFKINIQKKQ